MSKFVIDIKPELFNPDTIINSGQIFHMRKKNDKYIVCSGDKNNIPKITKTIEKLCEKFGTKHKYYCDYDINKVFEYYSFPTAVQISDLSLSELSYGSMIGLLS